MTTHAPTLILLILAITLSIAAPAPAEEPPEVSHDGLHRVEGTQAALVYVKPETDFSRYQRFLMLDAHVAFRKGWFHQQRSSVQRVTKNDVERIKERAAELLREVFTQELTGDDGYPAAEEAAEDVLLLRPAIIDLDVVAPDVRSAGRSYNFASSAGAATLYLELYDSLSGEILARAADRKAANYSGAFMQWTTRLDNEAAARRIFGQWAGLLRAWLDDIHGRAGDAQEGQAPEQEE